MNVDSTPATTAATPIPIKAQLIGPVANGDALPSAQANFTWNPGRGVTAYGLSVGSTVGGTDFYSGNEGTNLSRSVTVPTDGQDVYVTLHSLINGAWQSNNYVFASAATTARAVITAPPPGSLLTSPVTFTWNAGTGATGYRLSVGSSAGASDLYDGPQTLSLSQTVTPPTNGETVYVTLGSLINGLWLTNSYVYTAFDATKAVLLTPANQSVLTGASTTFTWDPVPDATAYWLSIGNTNGGSDIYSANQGTALTQTVTVPTDGRQLFVTLSTSIHGSSLASSSTFTAAGGSANPTAPHPASATFVAPTNPSSPNPAPPAVSATLAVASSDANAISAETGAQILSPTDQSPLAGSPITFTWDTPNGATEYWLTVGSSTIATDLYNASQGSNHSVSIALPTDGSPLYITLSSLINGTWQSNQYFYQAALP
jgi:hypothetical protein